VKKRLQIANELLVTEKNYVQGLDVLLTVYKKPLEAEDPPIISKEEIKTLFYCLEDLYQLHNEFFKQLYCRVTDFEIFQKQGVAGLFIAWPDDFLKHYTRYVDNYTKAYSIVVSNRQNPRFAEFLSKCLENPLSQLKDIHSILITPIQRIPRYLLLLLDLEKHTYPRIRPSKDQEGGDGGYHIPTKQEIREACTKMTDFAHHINTTRRNSVLELPKKVKSKENRSKHLSRTSNKDVQEISEFCKQMSQRGSSSGSAIHESCIVNEEKKYFTFHPGDFILFRATIPTQPDQYYLRTEISIDNQSPFTVDLAEGFIVSVHPNSKKKTRTLLKYKALEDKTFGRVGKYSSTTETVAFILPQYDTNDESQKYFSIRILYHRVQKIKREIELSFPEQLF